MGAPVERKRKDGRPRHTDHHQTEGHSRPPQGVDLQAQAGRARWLEKREAELKLPGGLSPRHDPLFGETVKRYEEELNGAMGDAKAACLRRVRASKLAPRKCSEIASDKIVEFAKTLDVQPQTRSNYLSHVPDLRGRRDRLEISVVEKRNSTMP